jgi:hypothetical protein
MATVAKEAQGRDYAGGARCRLYMGGHGRAWLPSRRNLRRPEVWKRGARAVLFVVWAVPAMLCRVTCGTVCGFALPTWQGAVGCREKTAANHIVEL